MNKPTDRFERGELRRAAGRRIAERAAPGDKLAYTVDEAAHALGMSPTSIWDMIRTGDLRKVKLLGRTLIKHGELERVLHEAEAAEPS